MNRQEMLRRVQALGFVVVDVGLYLNTHPNDTAASPSGTFLAAIF